MKDIKILIIFVLFYDTMQAPPRKQNPKKWRIIKGTNVELESYSFAASIIYKKNHVCVGSIISHSFVLTAAHCCFNKTGQLREPELYQLSVGSKYWQDGDKYDFIAIHPHQQYTKKRKEHDIALLQVKGKILMEYGVSTVRLCKVEIDEDDEKVIAVVMGWGMPDDEKGRLITRPSMELQRVEMKFAPLSYCKKFYGRAFPSTFCLKNPGQSKGTCRGDSGGPLVTKVDGRLEQIGIVSYGSDCNNTAPEVHTKVSSYYSWVKVSMKQLHRKSVTGTKEDIIQESYKDYLRKIWLNT